MAKDRWEWFYLNAAGAIGKAGLVDRLEVKLPGALNLYNLPPPPREQDLRNAIATSLHFLTVGPNDITVPLFASIWRAAMGPVDCALHLVGPTGAGKSELAALVQQHWGSEMTARQLPGNWSSTSNALEGLAHAAKDAIFTIDDFSPTGTLSDTQRLHREADRIFRAQGNRSGRQRMRADTTFKPVKPPRGLILSTGEDVPRGQSLRARLLVLDCSPELIHWDQLSHAQRAARQGRYAQSLAGFLQWLASRYDYLHDTLRQETAELRQLAHRSGRHRRTAQIVADLGIGLRYFLAYAQETGCISLEESGRMWNQWWELLGEVSALQAVHHLTQEPAQRYLELLSAALMSGRAHVSGMDGDEPRSDPGRWGWRKVTAGSDGLREEWRPQGERIGWCSERDLFLEPEASFAVAQKLARDSGESITISAHTLRRRLHERGYLASVEQVRETLTIRRMIEGVQRKVLHLNPETVTASSVEAADKSDMGSELRSSSDPNVVRFVRFQAVAERGTVVSDAALARSEGKPGTPEQSTCHSCGGTDFWRSIHGCFTCRACHPPAAPDLVAPEVQLRVSLLKPIEQGQEKQ